jgi:hypothetical protein
MIKDKDILQKGAKLKSRDYDFSTPEAIERIRKVKEKQKKILKSKKVSLEDLRKIVITI